MTTTPARPAPVTEPPTDTATDTPTDTATDTMSQALAELAAVVGDAEIDIRPGFDLRAEREALGSARRRDRALVSIRVGPGEVLVGPRWEAGEVVGCAGCAEARERQVLAHPLEARPEVPRTSPEVPVHPALPGLVAAAALLLSCDPLEPGELLAVSVDGLRRHRVARSVACPVCTVPPTSSPELVVPAAPVLRSIPTDPDDFSRGARPSHLLDESTLDLRLVDDRFGPVRRVLRESNVPFAMSMAVLAGSPVMGHGRALRFAGTRSVAVLEAYERLAGFPYDVSVVTDRSLREVSAYAVDPRRLGCYSPAQLAHPSSRVEPFDVDLPIDWVWGHELAGGGPRLVPADLAFYQYDYHHRHDVRASRGADRRPRRCFLESSSGCAVGSSFEEAAVHALFEVAERDAFQLAWHRRRPLPHVPVASIDDEAVRAMTRLIVSRGYDVHVLVATQDVAVPVVWVLALRPDHAFPASFSSAGSGTDPVAAVRSALREVAQLVTNSVDWTPEDVAPMLADPWQVLELEDHVRYYSVPETAPRAAACLGGPAVTLAEAYPQWPGGVARAVGHDVRALLGLLGDRFTDAGCPEVILVDQSSREHLDRGIAAVRAVVPGTVPMCFGMAHQRLAAIPRLDAVLADAASDPDVGGGLLDPHPFP